MTVTPDAYPGMAGPDIRPWPGVDPGVRGREYDRTSRGMSPSRSRELVPGARRPDEQKRSDVQDRATDLLPADTAGEDGVDGVYEHVRERVQALIGAARDLSDTCADLADALR